MVEAAIGAAAAATAGIVFWLGRVYERGVIRTLRTRR